MKKKRGKMLKKLLIMFAMVIGLCGCGKVEERNTANTNIPKAETKEEQQKDVRVTSKTGFGVLDDLTLTLDKLDKTFAYMSLAEMKDAIAELEKDVTWLMEYDIDERYEYRTEIQKAQDRYYQYVDDVQLFEDREEKRYDEYNITNEKFYDVEYPGVEGERGDEWYGWTFHLYDMLKSDGENLTYMALGGDGNSESNSEKYGSFDFGVKITLADSGETIYENTIGDIRTIMNNLERYPEDSIELEDSPLSKKLAPGIYSVKVTLTNEYGEVGSLYPQRLQTLIIYGSGYREDYRIDE